MVAVPFLDDAWCRRWRDLLADDLELDVIGRRCALTLVLVADGEGRAFGFEGGRMRTVATWDGSVDGNTDGNTAADTVVVRAPDADWVELFRDPPAPSHASLLALQRLVPGGEIAAGLDTLVRHLRAVHRIIELARVATREGGGAAPAAEPLTGRPDTEDTEIGVEPIVGRYLRLTVRGEQRRIYYEEAGSGVPLVCLHTAGADSRQYRQLMLDPDVTEHFRVVAFDLPWHGRSSPPPGWWRTEYLLTVEDYRETTMAVIRALDLLGSVVQGCSMGGSLVLELACRYPDELRGVIGLSGAATVAGRFGDWSVRPDINAAEAVPSWTYGLMAPQGPEDARREVWWLYGQGGPGVYRGDTYFYSEAFDLRGHEHEIDTNRCPVVLLTGEYDYACTPDDSRTTAERIPGAGLFGWTASDTSRWPRITRASGGICCPSWAASPPAPVRTETGTDSP